MEKLTITEVAELLKRSYDATRRILKRYDVQPYHGLRNKVYFDKDEVINKIILKNRYYFVNGRKRRMPQE